MILLSPFTDLVAKPLNWNQFEGCYITREVNGRTVKEVPYWNDGTLEFKRDNAFAVLNTKRKENKVFAFYMYVEGLGFDVEVLPVEVFLELGKQFTEDKFLVSEYKGRLPYKLKSDIFLDYDLLTKIREINPSFIEVSGHLNFETYQGKKKSQFKYTAKLEKVYCSKSKQPKKRLNILQPLKKF